MSVYKPCDIRGPVDELSAAQYESWGACIGRRLPADTDRVVHVGGDVRTHTPAFLDALVRGLVRAGANVINLGIVPTPMVYFAHRAEGSAACAIVTASHSPPYYNGLKWMIGGNPPNADQVAGFERETQQPPVDRMTAGSAQSRDYSEAYATWFQDRFSRTGSNLRVVVDPGSGCWSGRADAILRRVYPGADVVAIHNTPDGTFPVRDPDCARPEHLTALSRAVINHKADLGLAFDGDGDRVAFVDGVGAALTAEQATWALLHAFSFHGKAFVHDVKFSDLVPRAAAEHGAEILTERSGHAFIRARMLAGKALFGAEISGHYFYGELDGSDDGLFTAFFLIDYLLTSRQSLAELHRACPPVFMTPDLRVTVPDAQRSEIIAMAKKAFADRPQSSVDGVRIDFPDGWALMRGSVTEPALTFRFEGRDAQSLANIVETFCAALGPTGDKLRDKFHAKSHGAH